MYFKYFPTSMPDFLLYTLYQGSANYSLWTKYCLLSVFVNKVLFKHSHVHPLRIIYGWFCSTTEDGIAVIETVWIAKCKIFTIQHFAKMFSELCIYQTEWYFQSANLIISLSLLKTLNDSQLPLWRSLRFFCNQIHDLNPVRLHRLVTCCSPLKPCVPSVCQRCQTFV